MDVKRPTTEHVIAAYLAWYPSEHSLSGVKIIASHLRSFRRLVRRALWDEVAPADIHRACDHYEGKARATFISVIRPFIQWANDRFGTSTYQPPCFVFHEEGYNDVWAEWEALQPVMADLRRRCHLPHQRLTLEFGYIHLQSLEQIGRMTKTEFLVFPQRRSQFSIIEQVAHNNPGPGPLLLPWLGKGARQMYLHWEVWSGGVIFGKVLRAGTLLRWSRGIRPPWTMRTVKGEMGLLPPLTEESLQTLPELWEG